MTDKIKEDPITIMEKQNKKVIDNIVNMPNAQGSKKKHITEKFTDFEMENQNWLWPRYIPEGTVTVFAGAGGVGKSLLLSEIAARVTTFPIFSAGGQEHEIKNGNVIIMSAEDDKRRTLKPRLEAAGADMDKLFYMFKTNENSCINLREEIDLFENEINEIGNVKLIVIDPIQYFIKDLRDHITSEVADFICSLNQLADKYNCAIILNKHLRKTASGSSVKSARDEVSGSAAWINSVRQSFIITLDPEDEKRVLFCNLKVNITEKHDSALGYYITGYTVKRESDGLPISTVKITWHNEQIKISADEAVSKDMSPSKKVTQAEDFIINYLSDHGTSVQAHLIKAAKLKGHKERTLREAFAKLKLDKIINMQPGFGRNVNISLN